MAAHSACKIKKHRRVESLLRQMLSFTTVYSKKLARLVSNKKNEPLIFIKFTCPPFHVYLLLVITSVAQLVRVESLGLSFWLIPGCHFELLNCSTGPDPETRKAAADAATTERAVISERYMYGDTARRETEHMMCKKQGPNASHTAGCCCDCPPAP